jgi:hypothetical protein
MLSACVRRLEFHRLTRLPFKLSVSVLVVVLLDEAQQAEALQVLGAIFDVRERQSDERPENVAKITHTLAMLHYILHNIDKVCELVYCLCIYKHPQKL